MKPAFGLIFADLRRRDGLVRLDRNFVEALERRDPDLAVRLPEARRGPLDPLPKRRHRAIGSIDSPMQCALKEMCGRCLQPHNDPWKRKVSLAFSCFEQDRPLD